MRKIVIFLALLCVLPLEARMQWTEKQAWAWEKRTGVIKGFNSPTPPYPGMTEEEVMRKAAELGYNSLRWWYGGSAEEAIANITKACRIAEKYGMTISLVNRVPCIGHSFIPRLQGGNARRFGVLEVHNEVAHKGAAREVYAEIGTTGTYLHGGIGIIEHVATSFSSSARDPFGVQLSIFNFYSYLCIVLYKKRHYG